jgi:hypothetical protein
MSATGGEAGSQSHGLLHDESLGDARLPRRVPRYPVRVRMVRCMNAEPKPPTEEVELEAWCARGYSGRPIQTHIGDGGRVLWIDPSPAVCVAFDDGDERVLYPDEIEWITFPD